MGGGTRSVKFAHGATATPMVRTCLFSVQSNSFHVDLVQNPIDPSKLRKAIDMPRDYDMKINRNTMTVTISNGLSKQSSKRETTFLTWAHTHSSSRSNQGPTRTMLKSHADCNSKRRTGSLRFPDVGRRLDDG